MFFFLSNDICTVPCFINDYTHRASLFTWKRWTVWQHTVITFAHFRHSSAFRKSWRHHHSTVRARVTSGFCSRTCWTTAQMAVIGRWGNWFHTLPRRAPHCSRHVKWAAMACLLVVVLHTIPSMILLPLVFLSAFLSPVSFSSCYFNVIKHTAMFCFTLCPWVMNVIFRFCSGKLECFMYVLTSPLIEIWSF